MSKTSVASRTYTDYVAFTAMLTFFILFAVFMRTSNTERDVSKNFKWSARFHNASKIQNDLILTHGFKRIVFDASLSAIVSTQRDLWSVPSWQSDDPEYLTMTQTETETRQPPTCTLFIRDSVSVMELLALNPKHSYLIRWPIVYGKPPKVPSGCQLVWFDFYQKMQDLQEPWLIDSDSIPLFDAWHVWSSEHAFIALPPYAVLTPTLYKDKKLNLSSKRHNNLKVVHTAQELVKTWQHGDVPATSNIKLHQWCHQTLLYAENDTLLTTLVRKTQHHESRYQELKAAGEAVWDNHHQPTHRFTALLWTFTVKAAAVWDNRDSAYILITDELQLISPDMPAITYREWLKHTLPLSQKQTVYLFHLQQPDLSQDIQESIHTLRHGHKVVLWVDFTKQASLRLQHFLTCNHRNVRVVARTLKTKAFHVQQGLFWEGPWSSYILKTPTSQAPPLRYWLL